MPEILNRFLKYCEEGIFKAQEVMIKKSTFLGRGMKLQIKILPITYKVTNNNDTKIDLTSVFSIMIIRRKIQNTGIDMLKNILYKLLCF